MDLPPAGMTWGDYVERWVADCGGWLPLADQLIHRGSGAIDIALDPQTVERGLRRLARKQHQSGGQYGRWMLRFFGFTSPVEKWVRWLGNHHSRFSDLPSNMRLEQLTLWNRPPVAESSLACWILAGMAHAHHARGDAEACEHWLARAERLAPSAGPGAAIELGLLRAQLALDAGDAEAAHARHAELDQRLATEALRSVNAECYRARLEDQRASLYTRPPGGAVPDVARARTHYLAIPDSPVAYVAARRAIGLAYCAWKLGDADEARRLAARGVDAAGDGGLVRLRIAGLNLLSRIVPADEAAAVNARAVRMAEALQDEELMRRVSLSAPAPGGPAPR